MYIGGKCTLGVADVHVFSHWGQMYMHLAIKGRCTCIYMTGSVDVHNQAVLIRGMYVYLAIGGRCTLESLDVLRYVNTSRLSKVRVRQSQTC